MDSLSIFENKIAELKSTIDQLESAFLDEKSRLEGELVLLNECQEMLSDENLMLQYDFSRAINIANSYDFSIESLTKILNDVQNAISIKKELKIDDMHLSENQKAVLKQFIEEIDKLKKSIEKRLEELSKSDKRKQTIKNLEDLKRILSSRSQKDYVTEEMFTDFYETIDLDSLSSEDAYQLLSAFYNTKNLKGRYNREPVPLEDILSLYKEFLKPDDFKQNDSGVYVGSFAKLVLKHEQEITSCIDLENTRKILKFFQEKGILNSFFRTALLKVSVFGSISYIKKLYEKIMREYPEQLAMYFEDSLATLWVNDGSSQKKTTFRISPYRTTKEESDNLYSQCHTVTDEEFRENIRIMSRNSDLFSDKYDVANFGAHLKAKTGYGVKEFEAILKILRTSPWAMGKNIGLIRLFGIGNISKVSLDCFTRGNLEDKIHLAIELGLLNPPLNEKYRELESMINKNAQFQENAAQKQQHNQSIRNYFQRYTAHLANMTINEYAYLHFKLQNMSPIDFYDSFFSEHHAGKRSPEFLDREEALAVRDKDEMDQLIAREFMTNYYGDYINSYDEFDSVISEVTENAKRETSSAYYDPAIIKDPLIQKLEAEHTVMDKMTQLDKEIEVKNEFVYLFGERIISRLKVLHNASILKNVYGYLTEDMLLAAIVRNSFMSQDDFNLIRSSIKEREKKQ